MNIVLEYMHEQMEGKSDEEKTALVHRFHELRKEFRGDPSAIVAALKEEANCG